MPGKGLLERLAEGVVIGDGGYVTILEKRGYCRIGVWTPEATVEHPDAGMYVVTDPVHQTTVTELVMLI